MSNSTKKRSFSNITLHFVALAPYRPMSFIVVCERGMTRCHKTEITFLGLEGASCQKKKSSCFSMLASDTENQLLVNVKL